tara:strand:+ start:54 stop:296 length:243 start_codon:yes stop_codon:yes gene_type:complete
MANPVPGDLKVSFGRTYIVVNPNAAYGPPVFRISNPDEISGGGGGPGVVDIDGTVPITVNTGPSGQEVVGIDITALPVLP